MPTDLAIDYGTSNTVALVRGSDGRTRQLLFDGSPLLPSAVLAAPDGGLRAGRDAVRAARLDPGRYEPNPKRRIDESDLLLGERVFPVGSLIAATLAMVRTEALRVAGEPPARVLLTHPVAWGATRRKVLSDACVRAGLPAPTLIPEPVAAATYFAALPYVRIGAGQAVVVYDLGAGTFDVSVVRRGPQGFETLGYNGLDDVGGLDLDAIVVQHALGPLGQQNQAAWQRLTHPRSADDRRNHRMLWDDAKDAKETLSRQQKATFPLPLTDGDAMITRAEFERSAQPLLLRTIDVTVEAIRQSRVPAEGIAGVFLVGGGSRIPLVATLLHQRQGVPPTALEQPEIVVAEGALAAVHGGGIRQPSGSPVGGSPVGVGPSVGSGGPSRPPAGMGAPPVPPVGIGAPPVPPVGVGLNPPDRATSGAPSGSADRPASGAGAGAASAGLLWPGYNPPEPAPAPPPSGGAPRQSAPRGSESASSSSSNDPFGPPPALSVPQQPSMLWPDAPFDPGASAGSASPPDGQAAGRAGTQSPNRPSGRSSASRPPSPPSAPNQGGNWSAGPQGYGSGSSWPSGGPESGGNRPPTNRGSSVPPSGSYPPAGTQGVSQANYSGGARPSQPSSGRAYGRPARARQVFAWTDLLWLVPTLIWIAAAFGIDFDTASAVLFAVSSLALSVLGYPIDTHFHRRLPWWAKIVIPGLGGLAAGFGLAATSLPLVFAVLALLVAVGVAWLLMRKR